MKIDWNDLRYFLAAIDHGSTKRAAAVLKVDQTTCARRIGALEEALGFLLFSRATGRYLPTREALELADSARAMQKAADTFHEQAGRHRRQRQRRIRVTAEESLALGIVAPAVAKFAKLHPDIQVEIDVSRKYRDLEAGEADIAVRAGPEPSEPQLIRRKLADDPLGFYCSHSYDLPPRSLADLRAHAIACLDGNQPLFDNAGLGECLRHVATSMSALRAIIEQGAAVGALPRIVAEAPPALRLCFPISIKSGIWLLYPKRLRDAKEARALGRTIAETFREKSRAVASAGERGEALER